MLSASTKRNNSIYTNQQQEIPFFEQFLSLIRIIKTKPIFELFAILVEVHKQKDMNKNKKKKKKKKKLKKKRKKKKKKKRRRKKKKRKESF